MTDDQMAARAFEIADESMTELLLSHGIPDDSLSEGGSGLIGLLNENQTEVCTLADADQAIQDAYEWLHARGIAEIFTDADGSECIFLNVEE
jgi:hypothetical protein